MSEPNAHPSTDELAAFSLGQLPPAEAAKVESHISLCSPCCETMIGLSASDTFTGMLQQADKVPAPDVATSDKLQSDSASNALNAQPIPRPLTEHPRYEIVDLIGQGGMGRVYKARHRMMDRVVALKVINPQWVRKPEAIERFQREVQTAASLDHSNIVTAHDAEQAGDLHFLAMEFVDGVNLAETVSTRGPLPVDEACDYIHQAAVGLEYAHQRGMVHRDIKPHNLMVTSDSSVKILDFGLASLVRSATTNGEDIDSPSQLTVAGSIMGTPDFISPEQAQDARQADIRSDIYSLGMTLYYLLAGHTPFPDGNVAEKLKSHADAEPTPISSLRDDIPTELSTVIAKMISKNPNTRFQSPAEVAEAICPFAKESSNSKVVATSQGRRRGVGWVVAVALLLLGGGVGQMFMNAVTKRQLDAANTSLKEYLTTGASDQYSGNALNLLMGSDRGSEHLKSLDNQSNRLAVTHDNLPEGLKTVAVLLNDDRIRPKTPEICIVTWRKGMNRGSNLTVPRQITVRSVRFARDATGSHRATFQFVTSSAPQDRTPIENVFKLKPNALYQVDIDIADLIDTKFDGSDIWNRGEYLNVLPPKTELAASDQSIKSSVMTANEKKADLINADLEALQGNWQLSFLEKGGQIQPLEKTRQLQIAFKANTMKLATGSQAKISKFQLDPSTNPKSISFSRITTSGEDKQEGIYDIQGDTLRIASSDGGDRPTVFDSQHEDKTTVMMLKRVRPGDSRSPDEQIDHSGPFTKEVAVALIPKAASISNEDFKQLSQFPNPNRIKSKSLSLLLMSINPGEGDLKRDFQFLVKGLPKPNDLAQAMILSQRQGYVSMIQRDYITECEIWMDDDKRRARGMVTFNAPQLYIGSVAFEAGRHDNKWRIEKFHLLAHKISVVLMEDGNWKRLDNDPDPPMKVIENPESESTTH